MFKYFVVVFLIIPDYIWCQKIPENPCPNIFSYRQQNGVYFGTITVPYDGDKNMNLGVNVSMVGLYDNVGLKLEFLTPLEEILSTQVLRYKVNFPVQNVIPKITQIKFNNNIFCYGPPEPVGTTGITNLWAGLIYRINDYSYNTQNGIRNPISNPFIRNNVNMEPQSPQPSITSTTPKSIKKRPSKISVEESCGIANDIQALVLKGRNTLDNEYPWLVAMFYRQGVSYEFQCTANLITNQHVLTAAHCVWFYKAPLISKEDILLVLGRSELSHWATSGAEIRSAQEVTPHPSYQQDSGHCDIAIIKMNQEVNFKLTIRPVCLWIGDSSLKKVAGSEGVVAGWGKTEEGRMVVAIPRKITMPIVSQETCLRSHSDFQNLTSEMTFCAGNRDGSGPCSGDSGAGFVIKRNGKWYIRGVVSTAIKTKDYTCNLDEYIVFSDVAKLSDWIKSTTR